MTDVEAKCRFTGPPHLGSERYENYECQYEAEGDGLCIFHAKKTRPPENAHVAQFTRWRALIQRCDEEFAQLVRRLLNDPSVAECDFRGFQLSSLELPKEVSKPLDFRDAEFDLVSMGRIEFLEPVNFSSSKFHNVADFSKSTFRRKVDFTDVEFERSAMFWDTTFKSEARFFMARVKATAWFKKCHFASADFSLAEISDEAFFDESTFSSLAHFHYTKFQGDANFSKVTFESPSSFGSSVFGKSADFRHCKFNVSDFKAADFKDADFSNAVFDGPTSFAEARLEHKLVFINDVNQAGFDDQADFTKLSIGPSGRAIFRNTNLEKADFLHTDLSDFSFSDVNWHCHYHSRFRSRAALARSLHDQFRLHDQITKLCEAGNKYEAGSLYEALAENYRQLVLNYERKRDYETAEDFHIGEMEMRRKKKGVVFRNLYLRRLREWLNEYGLYRVSSAYGTSYLQAGLLMLTLLLLSSIAFLYSGFKPVTADDRTGGSMIEYNLFSDEHHHRTTFKQWASDYESAVSLSLSIITFQKDRFYEPLEGWSRFWLYIGVVVLTAQGAIVLLAVRRRFRR